MDDQEPGELERLHTIWSIYRAESMYNNRNGTPLEEWIKYHPAEWETVERIREMEAEWPQL